MAQWETKLTELGFQLGVAASGAHHRIVTAESCTGGLLAGAITEIAGSSEWYEMGFVTYATPTKSRFLGVDPGLIEREGVVSESVAQAMARGALAQFPEATLSVGITGYAGPSGGTATMPTGSVCIGWGYRFNEHIVTISRVIHVPGSRTAVRREAVIVALSGLLELIRHANPAIMPSAY